MIRRRDDLSSPKGRVSLGVHYDPEAFGRFSETIARAIGTARFLVIQTVVVVVWIALNAAVPGLRFDRYPFILLTLALSLQAAYAAPLILLAQNRQDERDRAQGERDREVTARTQADAEFLAREIASVRLALAGMPTADDLNDAVERLTDAIERFGPGTDAEGRPPQPRPQ
ncbi:MAG TPA: DUF1003 domain-containing protein [Acidimicrobiales bacterium]|nr:DUF1003 domain-containing protein [Acidimicrobiales bacterium]